jgi:hypothetical protein
MNVKELKQKLKNIKNKDIEILLCAGGGQYGTIKEINLEEESFILMGHYINNGEKCYIIAEY